MNATTPEEDRIFKCYKCGEWGPTFDCQCVVSKPVNKGENATGQAASPENIPSIGDTLDEYEKNTSLMNIRKKLLRPKHYRLGAGWLLQ